jgi:alpha-1,6-mannosyltransferase
MMNIFKKFQIKPFYFFVLTTIVYFIIFFVRQKNYHYGTVENQMGLSLQWALIFSTLLLLYFLGYMAIKHFSFKIILIGYFIFSLILVSTLVLSSADIYMYAMQGKIVSTYQENPYLKAPANFPNDPFLKFTCQSWWSLKQMYGPLWAMFSSYLARLGQNNRELTILLYKLWSFFGNSLILLLLYKIAKIYNPKKIKQILFLYAWNPFILIEFVNNAHNDVWMIFFGVLAAYFYYYKKDIWIIPSLVLAGLVKYLYWMLIPVFFIFLLRKKRMSIRQFAISGIISLSLLIITYLPFWEGGKILGALAWQEGSFWGQMWSQYIPLMFLAGLSLGSTIKESPIFSFIFLSWVIWINRVIFLILYIKKLFAKELIKTIIIILGFAPFLLMQTLYPWYLLWMIPFLILINNVKIVILWSTIALFSYIFLYSPSFSLIIIGSFYLLASTINKLIYKFLK